MSDGTKVRHDAQPAFVLHSYPYLETSLVLDVFSQNYGRVAMVARGARRPRSVLRGVLLAFQPVLLSWAGKSELRTLHKAEWRGGMPQLKGTALLCAFYINELIVKLLPRDDPHEALYAEYVQALHLLCAGDDYATTLRRFEKVLLRELGYALTLDRDVVSGEPVAADRNYCYEIERGPVASASELLDERRPKEGIQVSGLTLLDMLRDEYSTPASLQQSKALMRMLINHYLGNQVLHTRQLLVDLKKL